MKKLRLRTPVLFLLFLTVLAPIVLYTDRIGSFTASSSDKEFIDDAPTVSVGGVGDDGRLNLLPQELPNTLREPIGIIFSDNSSNSDKIRVSVQELQSVKSTELKTRSALSATDDEKENPIKLVTGELLKLNESDGVQKSNEKESGDGKEDAEKSGHVTNVSADKTGSTTGQQSAQTSGKTDSREPHQTVMPDARVRQLKDQLIRGKVYLGLSATRLNPHYIRELRLRMKEVQKVLGDATKDSDLPRSANDKFKAMEQTLTKGKQIQDDCATVIKKLRAILHSTEEQLRVHKKQTMFLTQLAAKTLPKGLHCLPLRLSTEYYSLSSEQQQFPNQEKLEDPSLYHYALFSDNILAAAVVVNSTVSRAKDPAKHVFHVVTDRLNYASMRMWFIANPPGKATIQVQNIEEFTWLNSSYSPVLKQLGSPSMIDYYFKAHRGNSDSNLKFRNPKYLSILNHIRFYLPEIFPKLNKVLFVDDDIVVQKDLSGLWSINLKGNVNGAVETCGESFHRFDRYLNFSNPLISSNFDPRACGWAYGMNIFDLEEWKKQNRTEVYHRWQKLNHNRQLWKLGTLPPGLITFYNSTFPLSRSWHVLGLGYNPDVNQKEIDRAAVIHYNGNMKPWLEIGMPKYRNYWARFIDYEQVFLRDCNINP